MKAFAVLNRRSQDEISGMLEGLGEEERRKLVKSMREIEGILGKKDPGQSESFFLRGHQPGDMGWITYRHGVLYAQEYGWDESFEAFVAQIASDFIKNFDPKRERCIIAERDGEIAGFVCVVRAGESEAKLRLLLVEPKARGLGLGSRLVKECIDFSKRAGYTKLVLWTNSVLKEARSVYMKAGFEMVKQEEHHSFGKDLVGEYWEMAL
jgi:GNAT superfamily N-acetyltransferase